MPLNSTLAQLLDCEPCSRAGNLIYFKLNTQTPSPPRSVSGRKYWSDNTPVAGQQFEYAFADIGNRTSTKAGGDENGANLRPASYTVSALNQYTSRAVPGTDDVLGWPGPRPA